MLTYKAAESCLFAAQFVEATTLDDVIGQDYHA